MITKDEIKSYISSIPPSPTVVKEVLLQLDNAELSKAAKSASQDPSLKFYLQNIVNKPIYSFKNEIKDINQIFGVLGLALAKQIIYNYMILLLSPKEWKVFHLSKHQFSDFQDTLSLSWKKILEYKQIKDKTLYSAISLLPASILVCESLFQDRVDDVTLLRASNNIDYNTILKRLSGMDLYDICKEIALAWDIPQEVSQLVLASKGEGSSLNDELTTLSKWMHLLFFYQLSQPLANQAGLNDFVEFNIEYVQDIYEEFQNLMMEES